MSKQLTLSATLSVLAMAAVAFGAVLGGSGQTRPAGDGAATAHGSLIRVLIQA